MRSRAFVFMAALAALLWLNAPAFGAVNLTAEFNSANDLYAQGKFAEAADTYERAAQSGTRSAALYFNLGNAWFKTGQTGKAIAAYHQAERLAPRDPDIRANLQFVRNQVQGPTLPPDRWERVLGKLTVNEWTVLALIPFWICLLLLMAIQFRPAWKPALGSLVWGSGLCTLVLIVCLAAAMSAAATHRAVVIAKDAPVRFGPLDDSPGSVTAHDGAEVGVVDSKGDWLLVRAGNRTGWLKREQVFLPENFQPPRVSVDFKPAL